MKVCTAFRARRHASWPACDQRHAGLAQEQFIPCWSYRTGAYAPNGMPWANGKQDYLK
jgi:hypothetical protein